MKTSTIVIAIIGIAIIGYLIYKYVYLPKKILTNTITTNSTTPSTISSSSTSSSSSTKSTTTPYHLTSVTQNYSTPPSSGVYIPPKTEQITIAQRIHPVTGIEKTIQPITTHPINTYSSVHQTNPLTISTGIGKYIRPMGGIANPNGESKTVNRNSYSYIQEIEKINKPFIKTISAVTIPTQPQKTTTFSSSSFIIHRPGLPTFSELKKQNPYLR
ncbi:MAG: hypothetical protein OH363_06040 [Candidatus Parvarchaeota archaeon]|nr:hypothetical protein [Candidatus Jingweiarchaeum tengchongense]